MLLLLLGVGVGVLMMLSVCAAAARAAAAGTGAALAAGLRAAAAGSRFVVVVEAAAVGVVAALGVVQVMQSAAVHFFLFVREHAFKEAVAYGAVCVAKKKRAKEKGECVRNEHWYRQPQVVVTLSTRRPGGPNRMHIPPP